MALLSTACSEPSAPTPEDEPAPRVDASEEPGLGTLGAPAQYFRARLEQTIGGTTSRDAFLHVLDAYDVDPVLAARAALELAELAAAQRRRRVALELIARASALGAGRQDVIDRASQLREQLASVSAEDIEVRGPSAPAALTGVSAAAEGRFAEAEELLTAYLRRGMSSRLEEVQASVRAKRAALESAARAYRDVIELGDPVATAAAEFRIASIYYDASLSLTYALPRLTREMVSREATRFRASQRSIARANRGQARAAYRRSLQAAAEAGDAAVLWRNAAQLGLTSVEDLLRGG